MLNPTIPPIETFDSILSGKTTAGQLIKDYQETEVDGMKMLNRDLALILQNLGDSDILTNTMPHYKAKPNVFVDPDEKIYIGVSLHSITHKQNYEPVNSWAPTLDNLKEGKLYEFGIRESDLPLHPRPFNRLH